MNTILNNGTSVYFNKPKIYCIIVENILKCTNIFGYT